MTPQRRWKRRSKKDISERVRPPCHRHRRLPARARGQEPAALHHLRLGRRRQEHADRPAAVRVEDVVRRPAGRDRGRLEEVGHAGRRHRLRAAGRRSGRRARTGHHDRRRLPLLRHRPAQVHRRRHARPRAVHAQHGHRRVHRRRGGDPGRRPQGRADPDAPAHLPRDPARHPHARAGRQQDGSGRLRRSGLSPHRRRLPCLCERARRCTGHVDPAVRAARRQHHRSQRPNALVPRPDADGLPGDNRARRDAAAGCAAAPAGAVGQPPASRLPRLLRPRRQRSAAARRPRSRAALGAGEPHRAHRGAGRRRRAGRCGAVCDRHADR